MFCPVLFGFLRMRPLYPAPYPVSRTTRIAPQGRDVPLAASLLEA